VYPPLLSTALPCTNDNIPPTLSSAVCPPPVSHAIAVCCNMEENQLTEGRKDFCKPCTGCACSVTKLISFHFPLFPSFRHRPFQRPFSLVPLLAPIARAREGKHLRRQRASCHGGRRMRQTSLAVGLGCTVARGCGCGFGR
jgi:hypothetical protein